MIEAVDYVISNIREFPAVLYIFLADGKSLEYKSKDVNHFTRIGEALYIEGYKWEDIININQILFIRTDEVI